MVEQGLVVMKEHNELPLKVAPELDTSPASVEQLSGNLKSRRLALPVVAAANVTPSGVSGGITTSSGLDRRLDPVSDGRLSGFRCSVFPRTPIGLGSGASRRESTLARVACAITLIVVLA